MTAKHTFQLISNVFNDRLYSKSIFASASKLWVQKIKSYCKIGHIHIYIHFSRFIEIYMHKGYEIFMFNIIHAKNNKMYCCIEN